MVPYLEVLQPLAERGHKVTVVTDSDASAWLAPNYPGVEMQFVPNKVNEIMRHMRSGNSSMAKDMMDPNRRGKQQRQQQQHVRTTGGVTRHSTALHACHAQYLQTANFRSGDTFHPFDVHFGRTLASALQAHCKGHVHKSPNTHNSRPCSYVCGLLRGKHMVEGWEVCLHSSYCELQQLYRVCLLAGRLLYEQFEIVAGKHRASLLRIINYALASAVPRVSHCSCNHHIHMCLVPCRLCHNHQPLHPTLCSRVLGG